MRKLILALLGVVLLVCQVGAQDYIRYIVGVQVVDKETGRIIPMVSMQIKGTDIARITDSLGGFSLYIPAKEYTLQFSHIAYEGLEQTVTIHQDTIWKVQLSRKNIQIGEVEIVGGKILNITRGLYTHVSDYVISDKNVIFIGHPSKKPEFWLFLTYENGKVLENRLMPKGGVLQKDYLDRTWYLCPDSARMIRVDAGQMVVENPITLKTFTDSISPILLRWKDKLFYQDYYPDQQGLMTYYNIPPNNEYYTISAVKDSLAMYLSATRMIDGYATWIADMYEKEVEAELKAGRSQMGNNHGAGVAPGGTSHSVGRPSHGVGGLNRGGGAFGGGGGGSKETNYHKPKNFSPIPILRNIVAPVFIFNNQLIQMDFYAGYISFYNNRCRKVSSIPIDFHVYQRPMGKMRRIYSPLIDYDHQQIYVWTQLIDRVEISRLNLETGQLLERLDLDQYKNVHNLQIANGSLFFLYDELYYPFATKLFRMDLKAF
jgi:hypothetical protein